MKKIKILGVIGFVMAMIPAQGFAHALWKPGSITPPRNSSLFGNLKVSPCGGSVNTNRGVKPKIFRPNEIITVEWIETVDHVGLFLMSQLDKNYVTVPQFGIDNAAIGISKDVVEITDTKDAISSGNEKLRNIKIKIPIAECAECALQLIQEMWPPGTTTRPPPNDPNANPPLNARTYYYSCSDIRIQLNSNAVPGEITFPATQSRINGADNIILNWINPSELDTVPASVGLNNVAYRVLILQSNAPINIPPGDLNGTQYSVNQVIGGATVAYDGNLETATIASLANTNSSDNYFKLFTYNVSNLYSNGVESSPMQVVPVQPILNLSISQGNLNNPVELDRTKGIITATANVTNATLDETYSYDWSSTDTMIGDIEQTMNKTDEIFQFNPSSVDVGSYNISLTATSNVSGLTSEIKSISINVVVPDAVTSATPSNNADSGGCTLSPTAKFDPLLLLLAILSIGLISFRARKQ